MWRIKILKVFEVAWILAALFSIGMGIYKLTYQAGAQPVEGIGLFVIAGLCVFLAVIKRHQRKYLERKFLEDQASEDWDTEEDDI